MTFQLEGAHVAVGIFGGDVQVARRELREKLRVQSVAAAVAFDDFAAPVSLSETRLDGDIERSTALPSTGHEPNRI